MDLLVVGRFGTTSGLSAASTGSQVLNLVTFVITQFAMGITVLIARYIIVTAVLFRMVGYFNGHDRTVWVMAQGLTQTLLVRLPLAYYMSIQPDASLMKIGFAAPAATIFGILLNVGYYLWSNRKSREKA